MEMTAHEIAKILKEQDNILLLCHIRPDGDTLGSAYALKYALQAKGKTVDVSVADVIPPRLAFIGELEADDRTPDVENAYICAVDVAQRNMLGANAEHNIDMKIDHHERSEIFAPVCLIEPKAAACGEIIYEVIKELEKMDAAKLTKASATALFTALSSDTGCFKYSNVTAKTMRIAADLIDAGADNYDVNHRLFEVKTAGELAAKRLMLNETEYLLDGRVGILVITADFRKNSGADDDDIGSVVSDIREVKGIDLAITLKQDLNDLTKFKISMRSSLKVNASDLCALFGGGGHARAAGASLNADSPNEAKQKVLDAVLQKV